MKRLSLFILCLVLGASLVACDRNWSQEPDLEGSEPEQELSTEQEIPEPVEEQPQESYFQIPEMDERQRIYSEQYIAPLLDSGVLAQDWTVEDYDSLRGGWKDVLENPYLLFAFENIQDREAMQELRIQYGYDIPADLVVPVLTEYFAFSAEQIRDILSGHHDAQTDTYHYMGGRQGISMAPAVTGIEETEEFIVLDYEVLFGGISYEYTLKHTGRLTLQVREDGRHLYWGVATGEILEMPL